MAHVLKIYLVVTGIGAAISLLMPGLVVVGLFLIVPGLILAVMPTAFLWGSVFAAIWFAVHGWLGNLLAAALALAATAAVFWLAPLPSRSASAAALAAAIRPDVTPAAPIALAGHIRIDMVATEREPDDPDQPGAPRAVRCNALCAAALFTDGVETVTLNPLGYAALDEAGAIGTAPLTAAARTFRRVPHGRCTDTLRPSGAAGLAGDIAEVRAIEAEWNLRLSTRDCIVAEPTRTEHDMVIAKAEYFAPAAERGAAGYGWKLGPRNVRVSRLEIRARNTVLLRKLIATTDALAQPLWIGAGGTLESFHFGWERKPLSNAPRFASLDAVELLRAHSNIAAHADPAATANLVRQRLAAMLADPALRPTDPGWAATEAYFETLKPGKLTDLDRTLLPALIRDRRMTRFDGLWSAIRAFGAEGTLLRAAMVERLADSGPDDQTVRTLGKAIASLPPGTFAEPTAAERALLADPVARTRAPGLIIRQADAGAAAAPLLVEILEYHARAWAAARNAPKRGPRSFDNGDAVIVDAARMAFCKLGPDAAAALPPLLALYREGLLDRRPSGDQEWMFALARLGQPVESFAKPDSLSGTTAAFHAGLRQRLQNFRPERDCRSNFV